MHKQISKNIIYQQLLNNEINNIHLNKITPDEIILINEKLCANIIKDEEYVSIHRNLIYRCLMRQAVFISILGDKHKLYITLKNSLTSIIFQYKNKIHEEYIYILLKIMNNK